MVALYKTPDTATHGGEAREIPCFLLCIFDCFIRYDWFRDDLKLRSADGSLRVEPN